LDTIQFAIDNRNLKVAGVNKFTVTLDPFNSIPELNDLNNKGTFEFFISKGNTINLLPVDQAIVTADTIRFTWQPTSVLDPVRSYQLQYDSDLLFSNPTSFLVTGENYLTQDVDFGGLSIADSTVIYWRTKFELQESAEDTLWTTNSFTYIKTTEEGWGQFNIDQFSSNGLSSLSIDATDKLVFEESSLPVSFYTMGTSVFDYDALEVMIDGVNFIVTDNTIDPFCKTNTINFMAFDKVSSSPYRTIPQDGNDVENPLICGRLPQMIFNLTEELVLGSDRYLDALISNAATGDKIALFSFDSVAFSNWDNQLMNSLENIGVDVTSLVGLVDGQPLIIYGEKGSPAGSAIVVSDDGTILMPKEKFITYETDVVGKATEGKITTTKIGPANSWFSLDYGFVQGLNDEVTINVIGVDKDGNEEVIDLSSNGRRETLDLSAIDANVYPHLKLIARLTDEINQTPAQFENWSISYEIPPEGIVLLSDKNPLDVQEGEEIRKTAGFVNISNDQFTDSLVLVYSLMNTSTGTIQSSTSIIPSPGIGDTSAFEMIFESIGIVGKNNLRVQITPRETELYLPNNSFGFSEFVTVREDDINPILDVTFDGEHIMDGDIVSARPSILFMIKDESEVLLKSDTTGIEIEIKPPGEASVFERLSLTNPDVIWTPATGDEDFNVEYRPSQLEDGIYTLRAQVADETGNLSAAEPYEISFEVINKSTVTHFYPYPNPFSTSCRFVFTLTGSTVPDRLLIQIMTISGRVVREIDQAEIGPLKIGNNISDFLWDGTDQFGDRLANGVYLYRVMIQINGTSIEHRSTSADMAFNRGYGKLYILR
jgi:hypothetical protein